MLQLAAIGQEAIPLLREARRATGAYWSRTRRGQERFPVI